MAGLKNFLRRVGGKISGQISGLVGGQVSRFRRDENGSMAMMMGLTAIPLIFAVGAGVDYGSANMVKSKLDAVADTAALSAVDHLAITGTAAAAQATAQGVFSAEAVNIPNLTVSNMTATVTN